MVEVFDAFEEAGASQRFGQWCNQHPNGFCVSLNLSACRSVLHRASYHSLRRRDVRETAYNTKVCSTDSAELMGWFMDKCYADVEPCRSCSPL
jgi:hypothetical protein